MRAPAAAPGLLQAQRGRVLRRASSSRTRSSTAARAGTSRASTPSAATCATSAWTASASRGHRHARSSRARRSTRRPRSTAGCARARSRRRGSRGSGSRPSARAGRARSAASRRSSPTARSIVELSFKGTDFLVRDVLAEAGDAAVLEPAERARSRARSGAAPTRRRGSLSQKAHENLHGPDTVARWERTTAEDGRGSVGIPIRRSCARMAARARSGRFDARHRGDRGLIGTRDDSEADQIECRRLPRRQGEPNDSQTSGGLRRNARSADRGARARQAFTTLPVWQCRGSAALHVGQRQEPRRADRRQRQHQHRERRQPGPRAVRDAESGAGNTATQLGIPQDLIGASTAQAEHGRSTLSSAARSTRRSPRRRRSRTSRSSSPRATIDARRRSRELDVAPRLRRARRILDAEVRRARARSPTSRSAAPIGLDQLVDALTTCSKPLGALVEIKINEKVIGRRRLADGPRAAREGHPRQRRPRSSTSWSRRARSAPTARSAIPTSRATAVAPWTASARTARSSTRRQPLRHRGRHSRVEPRRHHRRTAVPGSERRHGRPDRRRTQAVRGEPVPRR